MNDTARFWHTPFGCSVMIALALLGVVNPFPQHALRAASLVTQDAAQVALDFVAAVPGDVTALDVGAHHVYALNQTAMRIIDVTDPYVPVVQGTYQPGNNLSTLRVIEPLAYVMQGGTGTLGGLYIADVSDPISPTQRSYFITIHNWQRAVDIQAGLAVMVEADPRNNDYGSIGAIDVRNSYAPQGKFLGYAVYGSAEGLALRWPLAFIANGRAGLYIIDFGLYEPNRVQLSLAGNARDIDVVGTVAYLATGDTGLQLVDVTNYVSATRSSGLALPGYAEDVRVVDGLAFVAAGSAGVHVVDVSDPQKPTLLASYDTPGYAVAIRIKEDIAYVADRWGGLQMIRLRRGSAPVSPPQGSGQVVGVVRSADGTGLAGITVDAYHQQYGQWRRRATTSTTSSSGGYAFTGLAAGTYRLAFHDPNRRFASTYYPQASSLAGASNVQVAADTVTADIDVVLPDATPPVAAIAGSVASTADLRTGTLAISAWRGSTLTLTQTVQCPDQVQPGNVQVAVGDRTFPLASVASSTYGVTLRVPEDIPRAGDYQLVTTWNCAQEIARIPLGTVHVTLYDPSGQVTDARTGKPMSGAQVALYRVDGWRPRSDSADSTIDTCESNASKAAGTPWLQPAPTERGVFADPALLTDNRVSSIRPAVNPQLTGNDGRYAWDVAQGCWYVVVIAPGYAAQTSPVVGVPPLVTDLDIALRPFSHVHIPFVMQ